MNRIISQRTNSSPKPTPPPVNIRPGRAESYRPQACLAAHTVAQLGLVYVARFPNGPDQQVPTCIAYQEIISTATRILRRLCGLAGRERGESAKSSADQTPIASILWGGAADSIFANSAGSSSYTRQFIQSQRNKTHASFVHPAPSTVQQPPPKT